MKKVDCSRLRRLVPARPVVLVTALILGAGSWGLPGVAEGRADDSDPVPVRTANWELAAKWLPDRTLDRLTSLEVEPHWLSGSDRFWYRYRTREGVRYWLVDPVRRTKEPLFDCDHVAAELTRSAGEPYDGGSLDLGQLTFLKEDQVFRFRSGGHDFEYDRSTRRLTPVEVVAKARPEPEPWQNLSPDRSVVVFGRGHDLYLWKTGTPEDQEARLTTDGELHYGWGGLDEAPEDETERRRVEVTWSKDSRRFCVIRSDQREVEDLWLIDHLNRPRPKLTTFKCPMPGEQTPTDELWIGDVEAGALVRVATERWPDQILWDLFTAARWWSEDSSTLYFTRRSRDYFSVDLCAADPTTGETRTLIEERLKGQIYLKALQELPTRQQLLWWSMRDGWGHLYLHDLADGTAKQLTTGSYNVDEIVEVDEEAGLVFFTANGREDERNVYYRHFYRVRLDGTGLTLLTPEDAEHACTLSPTRAHFVDNYSRVDSAPRAVVRNADGELILELETADLDGLREAGWKPPLVFSAKSADGITDQWGVLYRPHDFDRDRQYPIVTRVYPGRQGEFVPRAFLPVNAETCLAQLGFIVVQFGNRGGTYERGLAYREHGREEFRDYGLADKRAVIEQLADRYDWIDLDRVGIYGGSSGGFMTTSAMLVHADFFKVGVAMTSPNDPSAYYNLWAERYYGVEQVTDEDGTVRWESAPEGNLEVADRLQGKLLMIYGESDTNVHPTHLFRMAQALIEAGKRFDMFVIPGADHALGDWRYLYGLVWDYFAAHLLGDPREGADCFPEAAK